MLFVNVFYILLVLTVMSQAGCCGPPRMCASNLISQHYLQCCGDRRCLPALFLQAKALQAESRVVIDRYLPARVDGVIDRAIPARGWLLLLRLLLLLLRAAAMLIV